jgi:uncharacterized membrane protein YhaH (DUF805 family)
MKPVYNEDATKAIQDIMTEMDAQNIKKGDSWILDRKQELILKMKEDTDNKEYPIMFNALILMVSLLCMYHIVMNQNYFLGFMLLVVIGYYVFVTKKLKIAIQRLHDDQKNINDYMFDGYVIKDTRFTAVKFAYLIFFPVICILLYRIVEDTTYVLPFWQYLISAIVVSSVAWFLFFSDDQNHLESLESEIQGLVALSSEG